MVKFYTQSYTYDYPFPTVTLAYFLRYPNPFSTHVLSTDVISRSFDAESQTLHTTRLHLKRSKLPTAVLNILPRSLLGTSASSGNDSQAYILEHSAIDLRTGTMRTENRNLDWTGVLSVVERQTYTASGAPLASDPESHTAVSTTVTLSSRLGQRFKRRPTAAAPDADEDSASKLGFFKSWSQASIQRSIEAIGLKRASKSQPNAKEGMKHVLERLRSGGLGAVLEEMRRLQREGQGFGFICWSHGWLRRV
ncbi:hypothetical protein EJ06DRAFT_538373 [Trichodelitschia bisporula]|uniref:PRELI/MSF1 domain-containing protein n=1 Tax=Trichodelitschia bisporula TaxID=703511 RepID=A0A6G1HUP7_9PEZI|nr:hypothetical protein EJ06DRAFT_538373 [Trichodelitschia bisporula]